MRSRTSRNSPFLRRLCHQGLGANVNRYQSIHDQTPTLPTYEQAKQKNPGVSPQPSCDSLTSLTIWEWQVLGHKASLLISLLRSPGGPYSPPGLKRPQWLLPIRTDLTDRTGRSDYYQRLTLESWLTNLEQAPLKRCQQLPALYKRLINNTKTANNRLNWQFD